MDFGLQLALLCLAARLLQPPVVPDGHHAEHREEERAAVGQDVPGLRGDQEVQGGDDSTAEGRRVYPRLVHGGCKMGHQHKRHWRELPERSLSPYAGHVNQSSNPGQG